MGNAEMQRRREITGSQEIKKKRIMELNFISQSLQGKAGEFEKDIKSEKLKVRRAMENRNAEARTYAENAVRKHNDRINYLELSARLDGLIASLDASIAGGFRKSVGSIIRSLESALAAGNLQKLSATMDQLERQLDCPEVKSDWQTSCPEAHQSVVAKTSGYIMRRLADIIGLLAEGLPGIGEGVNVNAKASHLAGDVNRLMKEVADEYGLEAPVGQPKTEAKVVQATAENVDLNDPSMQLAQNHSVEIMGNAGLIRRRLEITGSEEITGNEEIKKDQIMRCGLISRSLQGRAADLEKEIKAEKLKVRRAMERRDMNEAQSYAVNAVRNLKARISYLHLAARLDVLVDRLNTRFLKTADGKFIGSILKSLGSSLASGNLQKLSETMDQLERQVASLDVKSDRPLLSCVEEETGSCATPVAQWQDNRSGESVDAKATTGRPRFAGEDTRRTLPRDNRFRPPPKRGQVKVRVMGTMVTVDTNKAHNRLARQDSAGWEQVADDYGREVNPSQPVAYESGEEVNRLGLEAADESDEEVNRFMQEVAEEYGLDSGLN